MSLPIEVVGIAFFKDKSLLISKSHNCRNINLYTLVGGKVEKGETLLQAAVRECKEEIGDIFNISEENLTKIMEYTEVAASNPNKIINMHVFLSKKEIDVPLVTTNEIIDYKWFTLNDDLSILSPSIRNHILKYAIENNLL